MINKNYSNVVSWTYHIQHVIFWNVRVNFFFPRISGNAASNKNIHGTVSEQLKKNFAKSRWKVVYSSP
jgi:hypothetical protein